MENPIVPIVFFVFFVMILFLVVYLVKGKKDVDFAGLAAVQGWQYTEKTPTLTSEDYFYRFTGQKPVDWELTLYPMRRSKTQSLSTMTRMRTSWVAKKKTSGVPVFFMGHNTGDLENANADLQNPFVQKALSFMFSVEESDLKSMRLVSFSNRVSDKIILLAGEDSVAFFSKDMELALADWFTIPRIGKQAPVIYYTGDELRIRVPFILETEEEITAFVNFCAKFYQAF